MTGAAADRRGGETKEDGLRTVECAGSVDTVVGRLRAELDQRGVTMFAVIDHAEAARAAGLELNDEVVVVFGTPAVGTRLMQENARAGIDLPLRILIWDDDGTTTAAYSPPALLGDRFSLTDDLPLRYLTDFMYDITAVISR